MQGQAEAPCLGQGLEDTEELLPAHCSAQQLRPHTCAPQVLGLLLASGRLHPNSLCTAGGPALLLLWGDCESFRYLVCPALVWVSSQLS